MSDLISRQAAVDAVNRAVTKEAARWSIQELPSVDAVQDEWIVREYCTNELDYRKWIEIECPFCGEIPAYENLDSMNYCPNCGAKMKGEEE